MSNIISYQFMEDTIRKNIDLYLEIIKICVANWLCKHVVSDIHVYYNEYVTFSVYDKTYRKMNNISF